ncbi:uncharacterized protein [Clytia hemisphaerica]|uniref:uncharacterized protein n=1 Tax=Clytia hemisphaerica TaxID=252671 RepID=UPI0034D77F17|eukprot:TCONS_00025620-protein
MARTLLALLLVSLMFAAVEAGQHGVMRRTNFKRMLKSTEISLKKKKIDKVFISPVTLLKESNETKKVLDEFMKRNGTMEEDGFSNMFHNTRYVTSEIANNGGKEDSYYSTSKSKCFNTFANLQDEIIRQHNTNTDPIEAIHDIAIGKSSIKDLSPVYIITKMFMDPFTRLKLMAWLKEKVKQGSDHKPNTLKKCKAHLIVEYTCCLKSLLPLLSPQYAEIKIRVG